MATRRTAQAPSSATHELALRGAPVVLRDGSHVRVRQIRRGDKELLLRGFERLSPESRYRRFLTPTARLGGAMLRYLTEIDHHDHEALIAIDEATGEALGVARYVREVERPDAADVAVTVIDDWQGKGLGTLLLEVLSARARDEAVTRFTALMLATNDEMIDLFKHLAPVRVLDRVDGRIEIEVPIPVIGLAPALRKLLRISAHRDVVLPRAAGRHPRGGPAGLTPRTGR
jgi:GNAT superfamily N-acetyltransferase